MEVERERVDMEADYGIVDGFDEPPHDYIRSLLSRDIIERKLAKVFFNGDLRRVEREYEALTEEDLEKFFIQEFGGGDVSRRTAVLVCALWRFGVHRIAVLGVHFKKCQGSRRSRDVCARGEKRRQVARTMEGSHEQIPDRL